MKGKLYEGSFAGCMGYLLRRAVLLGAKLAGFKGFCLFLGTALLCTGRIGEDVWLTLAVTLVCSASGIRVLDSLTEGADALNAKNALSERLGSPAGCKGMEGEKYENFGISAAASAAGRIFGWSARGGRGSGYDGRVSGPEAGANGREGAESTDSGGGASRSGEKNAERKGNKASGRAARDAGARGRDRIHGAIGAATRARGGE